MTEHDMSHEDAEALFDALTSPKQAVIDLRRQMKRLTEAVEALTATIVELRREALEEDERHE